MNDMAYERYKSKVYRNSEEIAKFHYQPGIVVPDGPSQ